MFIVCGGNMTTGTPTDFEEDVAHRQTSHRRWHAGLRAGQAATTYELAKQHTCPNLLAKAGGQSRPNAPPQGTPKCERRRRQQRHRKQRGSKLSDCSSAPSCTTHYKACAATSTGGRLGEEARQAETSLRRDVVPRSGAAKQQQSGYRAMPPMCMLNKAALAGRAATSERIGAALDFVGKRAALHIAAGWAYVHP